MNRKYAGFSIIEIMVVIAIVGILAMIAIPTYTNYVYRGYVSNVITHTADYQTTVQENLLNNGGILNCSNLNADSPNWIYIEQSDPNPSLWLVAIDANCVITGLIKNFNGIGFSVTWTPTLNNNGILTWTCNIHGGGIYGEAWAPSSCPHLEN